MTTVNEYRVWCTGGTPRYETIWGTSEPTVCPSDGGAIDTNLTTVIDSVSSGDTEITNFPLTAFGELSTNVVNPILQLSFTYGISNQIVKTIVTGSGTVTTADGMVNVSSGSASSSSGAMTSLKTIKYRPGQGMVIRFSCIFTAGVAGNIQLAGGYDIDNGIGFGFNGTSFGVFKRSAGVTIWIPQTLWNVDKFDGTGPSGANINFGSGFGNVFEIQYQYLGFGALKFKVEDPATGKFKIVHIIRYANTSMVPSFINSSFPLCIESTNTTNTTNISVKTASIFAGVEGNIIYTGPQFTNVWNNVPVANNSETFIAAYYVNPLFNGLPTKFMVYALQLSFATGTADKGQILRLRKGTVSNFTSPVWTDIATGESVVQILTGGSWNAGEGTILFQGNVAGTGIPTNFDIEPSPTSLYGVSGDTLIITLQGLGAGSNWGSLRWLEDQ